MTDTPSTAPADVHERLERWLDGCGCEDCDAIRTYLCTLEKEHRAQRTFIEGIVANADRSPNSRNNPCFIITNEAEKILSSLTLKP